MPAYPWLNENTIDGELIANKMRVLRMLNTPYTDDDIASAPESVKGKSEMDALIAYLQVLGTSVSARR